MSKIGTEIIVGQIFKPIVTTFTYDELQNYRDNDISIGINNALIFSIPQQKLDNDSSVDAYNETSIWATDNSGLLCPLSFPYSMIAKIKDSLDRYEENTNAKKIVSVNWTKTQGTSEAGTSPNINIKVEVKYTNDRIALLNVTGIKVYKNPQFTEEYVTVIAGGETINWYDRAGIYYLQGLVTDTTTGSIMGTTNELPLEWTITEIEMQTPVCTSNIIYHNSEHYVEIILSANVPGLFEITYHSDGNLDTNFGKITRNNGTTTFKLYNESYDTISPIIKYTFTPDNTKYYINTNGSVTVSSIEGIPIPYTYYWYVGVGPINTSIMPGTNSDWHIINGTPASIETGDNANSTKINWVLAVPTALNLNHLSNGDDVTDLYDVTTVTCADGVEYKVFTQARASKRIDVIFVE